MQMCKRSKEIQTLWQAAPGDFFIDADNRRQCWTGQGEKSLFKKGFKINRQQSIISIEKHFWLPRVNQLIEIAQLGRKAYRDTAFDFYEWVKKAYTPETSPANKLFISIEQLWFAYIMAEKFGKKWIDEAWCKDSLL